jgi:hypothetical protein
MDIADANKGKKTASLSKSKISHKNSLKSDSLYPLEIEVEVFKAFKH